MADIIGPVLIIALVFVIYHFAGKMDVAIDVKKSDLKVSEIDAETRREEALIESKRLDVEMGRLAIEARRLGLDTTDAKDVEYRFLEDDKKKDGSTSS